MLMLKFYCELCNFETDRKPDLNRHLKTSKHKKNQEFIKDDNFDIQLFDVKNSFQCECCEKHFIQETTLSKHAKNSCRLRKNLPVAQYTQNKMFFELKKQNRLLKTLLKMMKNQK